MREAAGQRHLHYFSAISFGIIENCFERWICREEFSVLRTSECFCAKLEDLTGTISEQDLIVINAVELGQLINQHVVVLIRITAA